MITDVLDPVLCDLIVETYEGDVNDETGIYEGVGMAIMSNKCTYEGTFHNGMLHGKGIFSWPNGVVFDGDFELGKINGKGSYTWPDGSTYAGDVKDGQRHGYGEFYCSTGQYYEGEWRKSLRNGQGKMFYNAERTIMYEGEWLNGLRQGYGFMRYQSGNTFEGEWFEDKKHGKGVMIWKDVDEVYLGDWASDRPNGHGEYIWAEGAGKSLQRQICNIYRGGWNNGARDGWGTFFYANGSQYSGTWKNNTKDGVGVFTHQDGRIFYGEFSADHMILPEGAPRETEDVCPQIRLNINDLIASFPMLSNSSAETQIRDLERLLLRYNSYTHTFYKRYTDASNKRRAKEVEAVPDHWPKIDKVLFQARNFHKRLFTMTLDQLCRFARECSIIGPSFTAYEVAMCLKKMRVEGRNVVLMQHRKAQLKHANFLRDVSMPVYSERLLDYSGESDIDLDPKQSILEREFAEVLIRCIAESTCRQGATKGLYDTVFKTMAGKIQPMAADPKLIPVFVAALYDDAVQNTLREYSPALHTLWAQVMEAAKRNHFPEAPRGVAQFRHMIQIVMTMRGTTIESDLTIPTLIQALGKHEGVGTPLDLTCLMLPIIFDDFTEMICRLVISEYWIFPISNDISLKPLSQDGGGGGSVKVMSTNASMMSDNASLHSENSIEKLEHILALRLISWLRTF